MMMVGASPFPGRCRMGVVSRGVGTGQEPWLSKRNNRKCDCDQETQFHETDAAIHARGHVLAYADFLLFCQAKALSSRARKRDPRLALHQPNQTVLNGIQIAIPTIIRFSVREMKPSGTLLEPPTQAHFSSRLSI